MHCKVLPESLYCSISPVSQNVILDIIFLENVSYTVRTSENRTGLPPFDSLKTTLLYSD